MSPLARGLAVIQAFSQQRQLMSISQISQKTGIPRAAVRRCLYTLSELGFVYAEKMDATTHSAPASWPWGMCTWPPPPSPKPPSPCCAM